MNVIRIKGGFGNQLFQYCFAKFIFRNCDKSVYLDIYSLKKDMNRGLEINFLIQNDKNIKILSTLISLLLRILRKISLFKIYREKQLYAFEHILNCNNTVFDGFWQNLEYISKHDIEFIKSSLLKVIPKTLDNYGADLVIHLRFGDFIGNPLHQVVNEEYYEHAIGLIENINDVIVVTDDKGMAESFMEKLVYKYKFSYTIAKNESLYEDLLEIGLSTKRIIPNSTFSFWACLLFDSDTKLTYCPSKWLSENLDYSGLVPVNWKVINV